MRKDGKFIGVDGTIPEGQGIVMAHLNECHELVEMVRFVFPTSISRDVLRTSFPPPPFASLSNPWTMSRMTRPLKMMTTKAQNQARHPKEKTNFVYLSMHIICSPPPPNSDSLKNNERVKKEPTVAHSAQIFAAFTPVLIIRRVTTY
jgi:hypothetical protein